MEWVVWGFIPIFLALALYAPWREGFRAKRAKNPEKVFLLKEGRTVLTNWGLAAYAAGAALVFALAATIPPTHRTPTLVWVGIAGTAGFGLSCYYTFVVAGLEPEHKKTSIHHVMWWMEVVSPFIWANLALLAASMAVLWGALLF